jgi:hypothetical protein
MTFPKKFAAGDAPDEVLKLVQRLVPLLIEGDHPALLALRQQFARARVKEVELTGHGFYVDFEVPPDVALAEPANFAGGDAKLQVQGVTNGAGCVLFVRGGRLAMLEGYTYGDDAWADNAVVLSIDDVFPIVPDSAG